MPIGPDQLEDIPGPASMGPQSRYFFESADMEFKPAKRHARLLPGLRILDESWLGGPGLSPCWTLSFEFEGYEFQIDANSHAGGSLYFVTKRDCPDDVLLRVLNHFDQLINPDTTIAFVLYIVGILAVVVACVTVMMSLR